MAADELLAEPIVLLAPPQLHRRVRKHGLATLADEPWVAGTPTSGLALALQRAADAAGFAPRVAHRVDGTQNICRLAATEAASAVVPRMAVLPPLERLIVPGIELGVRKISAVVREGRRRDPAIRRVIRELHDIVDDSWPEQFGVAV
jgi:DNA-binding transcriptional LysR family regulator